MPRGACHRAGHFGPDPLARNDEIGNRSRDALRARVLQKAFDQSPQTKGRWSAGRRQGRGPRHAGECYHSLALRARRAPQNDPLARTACFGRAAPPGAPPRSLCPSGRPASAGNRTRSIRRLCLPTASFRARFDSRRNVTKRGTIVKRRLNNGDDLFVTKSGLASQFERRSWVSLRSTQAITLAAPRD